MKKLLLILMAFLAFTPPQLLALTGTLTIAPKDDQTTYRTAYKASKVASPYTFTTPSYNAGIGALTAISPLYALKYQTTKPAESNFADYNVLLEFDQATLSNSLICLKNYNTMKVSLKDADNQQAGKIKSVSVYFTTVSGSTTYAPAATAITTITGAGSTKTTGTSGTYSFATFTYATPVDMATLVYSGATKTGAVQKIIVTVDVVAMPKLPEFDIENVADMIYDEDTNTYQTSEKFPTIKINSENATKLYYTLDGSEPTTDDSEISNGQIDLEALAGDKTEVTLTVKGWSSDGMSASKSATFKIVAPGAPTVDTDGLNTTNTNTCPYWVNGKYGYLAPTANIKLTRPAGAETVYYTTDGTTPNRLSRQLPDDNIITLSETVVGQKTQIRAIAANRAGLGTEILAMECQREAVTLPTTPKIRQFSQLFTFNLASLATFNAQLKVTEGSWETYNSAIQTIYIDDRMVLLDFEQPYANMETDRYAGNKDLIEAKEAQLQWLINQQPDATHTNTFYDAYVYDCDTKQYTGQNHWLAIGEQIPNSNGSSTTTLNGGNALFPNNSNECYLHLRAVKKVDGIDEPFVSDIVTVKICRKSPDAPVLTLAGTGSWNDRSSVPSLEYIGSTTVRASMSNPGYSIEYYFAEAKDGQPWPGADPGNVYFTPLPDMTNDISLGSNGGANSGRKGRLYVRQKDKAHNLTGACALLDIEPIAVEDYKLNDLNYRPAQQTLIRMAQDDAYGVKIMGVYETDAAAVNGKKTYYVYLMDQWGSPIKLVVNAATRPEILDQYADTEGGTKIRLIKGDVIGRIYYHSVTGEGNKMPEIWITPGSEDYIAYLPESEAVDGWSTAGKAPADCLESTKVSADNFNRKMRLRSLTWLGGNRVRTADGTELTLYSRLITDGYDFQEDMEQVAEIAGEEGTKLFAATGFVGQLNGQLALLTTEPTLQCPGTPNLFAPNPITGQPDADGYIAVNAISDEVTLTIKGNAHGESKFWWSTTDDGNNQFSTPGTLTIKRPTGSNSTVKRVIWSELNGMKSLEPAMVKFIFHTPEKVASIEEFKTKEFANSADPDAEQIEYYQMTGKAIIEEITPEYLYVRDYDDSPMAELIEDEHMRRMLIHNSNGWEALVADPDGGEARVLKQNDVITGFAICPHQINGNLISESTGFARTFKVEKNDAAYNPNPEVAEATPGDNFKFTDIHRMRLMTLKGVQVTRTPNTGDDREDYPYNYTLMIDGKPRMRMDIFRRSGFAEAYAENTGFDLTGVVLLDSEDEANPAYSFALLSFEGSGKVAMPEVYLEGIADKTLTEQPFVAGTIVMDAVKLTTDGATIVEEDGKKVTIHYSIDGLDPLQNLGSRHEYTAGAEELNLADHDVEIRAFAAYPGMTPSDVVVRRFRKQSNDVQYILNFLNTAREGNAYRFTSNVKAVAKGGDYLFVAGSVGHYLPIYREGGWGDLSIEPGQYINNFTVGYKVDTYGNRLAVATGYEHTFTNVTDDYEPAINPRPDEVTGISAANARRYVRISNVKVNAAGTANRGEWTITELSDGQTHPLMVGVLGEMKVTGTDADGNEIEETLQDGETYNLTGFVMLGESRTVPADPEDAEGEPTVESTVEFWPMSAVRVTRSAPVTAKMTNLTEPEETDENGDIRATFNGMTEVTLYTTGHNTTIYYWLESEEADESKATWYTYQRPFIVTAQERIHAKSQAEGMAESDHTHIILTPAAMSGDVEFKVDAEPGKTTVTITAAAGSEIWYSTDNAACDKRYTAGQTLTFEEETMLYACAKAPGMGRGPVSRMLVMVKDAVPSDIETTGNSLQFSQTVTEEGYVEVTISAASPVAGGTIYYTTEAGKKLPGEGVKYEGPIVMTESGVIIAVMVIEGRPASQTYETSVWVVPVVTGIDGVDSDRQEGVRTEGRDIVAPEGSEVYDIAGRRVRPTGLASGIYIVRTPDGKAVKVRI